MAAPVIGAARSRHETHDPRILETKHPLTATGFPRPAHMPPLSARTPPRDEGELLQRARLIAGMSLGEFADMMGVAVPVDLRRDKGWFGQLLETWLGADAANLSEPDFVALGVELKTLPVGRDNRPKESTYVCVVPLPGRDNSQLGMRFEDSCVYRKLRRVLWMPVQGERELEVARRRIGDALLWSPDTDQLTQLREDWEELMEAVCLGRLEQISARHGNVLQIRPKAANSRVLAESVDGEGESCLTQPRGFYLRAGFTARILDLNTRGA